MGMKALRVAWRVFVALVTVIVALGAISVANSSFERVVLGGLLLIYAVLMNGFTMLGHAAIKFGQAQSAAFVQLAEAIHHPDAEAYGEQLRAQVAESPPFPWVEAVTLWLLTIIAIVDIGSVALR